MNNFIYLFLINSLKPYSRILIKFIYLQWLGWVFPCIFNWKFPNIERMTKIPNFISWCDILVHVLPHKFWNKTGVKGRNCKVFFFRLEKKKKTTKYSPLFSPKSLVSPQKLESIASDFVPRFSLAVFLIIFAFHHFYITFVYFVFEYFLNFKLIY